MLSRFFSTSQPFHYLVGILLLGPAAILLMVFLSGGWQWAFLFIGCCLPLTLLLVQFIILKNDLTGQNSYGLFGYTMLILAVLVGTIHWQFALCLLFLLLALRRLLSLKNGTAAIRKIFDGTFWISIATLFQPSMVFFMGVVFTAVFLFDRTKWRHWVIPFISMASVAIISFTLEVVFDLKILSPLLYKSTYVRSGMLEQWQTTHIVAWALAVTAVIGFTIYIVKLVDIQQRVRPRFSVLTISGICALLLALFFDQEYVLLLVPVLAIFQVRGLEHIRHKGFREILFLIPVVLMVIAFFIR